MHSLSALLFPFLPALKKPDESRHLIILLNDYYCLNWRRTVNQRILKAKWNKPSKSPTFHPGPNFLIYSKFYFCDCKTFPFVSLFTVNVNYDVFFFFLSDLLSHGASILIPTASVLTPQFLFLFPLTFYVHSLNSISTFIFQLTIQEILPQN